MTAPCARPPRWSLVLVVCLGLAPTTATAQTAPTAPAPATAPATAPTTAPAPAAAPVAAPATAPAPDATVPAPDPAPAPDDPAALPDRTPAPVAPDPEPQPAPRPPAPAPGAPVALTGPQSPGPATEPAPRHRLVYSNAVVLRINPLGLEDRFSLIYRRRLSARTGKLWDDTYFGIGITPTLAPSVARIGPTVMLVPLAILQLRASYYFITGFGSQARADAKQGITNYGGQAELSALFQVKFGPIALIDEVIFFRNSIKMPGTQDVYYDIRHDMLVPADGWFLSNDASLVYVNTKLRLNAGVRATYYHVFYPGAAYEPGDVQSKSQNDHARVGPLISYAFKDRPERRFTKPTLFFAAQWWVKHRYRTGQEINQGLPMFVLGFSFTGELWSRK